MNYILGLLIVAAVILLLANLLKDKKKGALSRTEILNKAGEDGEKMVAKELDKLPDEYIVFNNILLKVKSGINSTQIDHLVISPYGVFVIETKNWGGTIYGKPDYEKWVRIKDNGRRNFFINPMKQNEGHINGLLTILPKVREKDIIPLVLFSDRGVIKYKDVNGVGYYHEAINMIKESKKEVLSDKDLKKIISSIKKNKLEGETYEKKHVNNAKRANYYNNKKRRGY